jgi:predicted dienelactone hydrolase
MAMQRAQTLGTGLALLLALLSGAPAQAVETVLIRLPLLRQAFTLRLSEVSDPASLLRGQSDLAELDRASGGSFGPQLVELFQQPLPIEIRKVVDRAAGTALKEQILLALSSVVMLDDLSAETGGDMPWAEALQQAAAREGTLTLARVLRELPGQSVTIDLEEAVWQIGGIIRQQRQADRRLAGRIPQAVDPALAKPGPLRPLHSSTSLMVPHRPRPLLVEVVRPERRGSGRLVLISHGIWDDATSFMGWANHLASHGYSVLLSQHPGSDGAQQRAMLAGKIPPPSPKELKLRPLDLSALLDGAAAGQIAGLGPVRSDAVVVVGHSWGATTALQLAGARPNARQILQRCQNPHDPQRNLSWVLQCSFAASADQALKPDQRVVAVVAVSPMLSLLFADGAREGLAARTLVIAGNRDWITTPDPEAVQGFLAPAALGHRLVLVQGGDHFNLRAPAGGDGGPLQGLLLTWVRGAFQAGLAVRPSPGAPDLLGEKGWGNTALPLVLVKQGS